MRGSRRGLIYKFILQNAEIAFFCLLKHIYSNERGRRSHENFKNQHTFYLCAHKNKITRKSRWGILLILMRISNVQVYSNSKWSYIPQSFNPKYGIVIIYLMKASYNLNIVIWQQVGEELRWYTHRLPPLKCLAMNKQCVNRVVMVDWYAARQIKYQESIHLRGKARDFWVNLHHWKPWNWDLLIYKSRGVFFAKIDNLRNSIVQYVALTM